MPSWAGIWIWSLDRSRRVRRRGSTTRSSPATTRTPCSCPTQAQLLGDFSRSIRAFLDDLAAAKLADRRGADGLQRIRPAARRERVARHRSRDGGAGLPRRAEGQGRLVGETPRLGELVDGDLKWSIDFRRVYATLLDQWLGLAGGRRSSGSDSSPFRCWRADATGRASVTTTHMGAAVTATSLSSGRLPQSCGCTSQ